MLFTRGLSKFQAAESRFLIRRDSYEDGLSDYRRTRRHSSRGGSPVKNLKDLTDGSISKAQPDFYGGSRPSELKRRVREYLGPFIVSSTNKNAPCLPNFFAEEKGPNGSAPIAKRKAVYDGALDARGVNKLQSYVDPGTTHDNNTYTHYVHVSWRN